MGKNTKRSLFIVGLVVLLMVGLSYVTLGKIVVLDPMGHIAAKEKDLLITSTLLMLIVVVPVFIFSIWIAWRYRAGHKHAKYDPNWENNNWAEFAWWTIPFIIVAALSWITWKSCYELNPFKPLESSVRPLRIQVVALQWKWLFIYPDHNIASVGFLQVPTHTPLNFEITSDAPMNSFWIPQLGGQIYAMPAMRSKLHLIAHEEGPFTGSSANLSGEGFARMTIQGKACTAQEFEAWVQEAKQSQNLLNQSSYEALAKPSIAKSSVTYLLQVEDLFDQVLMKYMMPMEEK